MNHLIVYAHPNPKSFSHAVKDTLVETLEREGHTVRVRDLYAMNFAPVLSGPDFVAMQAGAPQADVQAEQEHIRWADVVTLVYPIWWAGFPAILKGYVDRVLTYGFAFTYNEQGSVGLLKGKQAMVFHGAGHPNHVYDAIGMTEALNTTTDVGVLKFCGFEVQHHVHFGEVPSTTDEVRKGYLAEVARLAASAGRPVAST